MQHVLSGKSYRSWATVFGSLALAFFLSATIPGVARAAVTCTAGWSDAGFAGDPTNVVLGSTPSNSGCEIGSQNNDAPPPPPGLVNTNANFGINNWEFFGKLTNDLTDPSRVGPLTSPFDLAAYFGSNPFDNFSEIMVLLKGPNNNGLPYLVYLLTAKDFNSPDFNVTWNNTPWGGNATSHISLYVRPVPLPAALPLLLAAFAGLMGLFGWKRRQRRQSKDLVGAAATA